MKTTTWLRRFAAAGTLAAISASAFAQQPTATPNTLLGTNCNAPPVYHCPDASCEGPVTTQPGNTVEMKTRRTYFLDCPVGYQPGDKVTLVLSLHGAGSYANWQRNYAPFMDVKDKYKLVIMTPGSPTRVWSDADDQYLQNIVDSVVGAVGKSNVERFVLAGHSQGGMTSNRIICSDYFKDKVDVRISLSGGRIGPTTPAGRGFANGGLPIYQQVPGVPQPPPPTRAAAPAPAGPPGGACDYSFIFTNGEYETIPGETSPLADKFGCGPRVKEEDVIDPKAGYVWDATRQDPGTDGWGHYPRSGRATVYNFPNCKDGRVVADVVRLQKGHTEGLEPNVTEKLIKLATSAKGGKIKSGAWTPPAPPAAARANVSPGTRPN
ncbi:MAG TPA: alpha/beta hydrolase [Hyphomonadaceae bacterium]|nr:alpha/beta hydrolase [Hyphomonadaceae bacterium]HPN06366.1 alpha/beta hydrolase [Hyphomonadaceae bacterium]